MRVAVDDVIRTRTTMYIKKRIPTPPQDPSCGGSLISQEFKPRYNLSDTILGYRTILIRTTEFEGRLLHSSWKAPDLDCIELKVSEDRLDEHGLPDGHFSADVVDVLVGPPAASLFDIPSDYLEVSPSQHEKLRNPSFVKGEDAERTDDIYFRNHRVADKP
jgi:hypothetical protein